MAAVPVWLESGPAQAAAAAVSVFWRSKHQTAELEVLRPEGAFGCEPRIYVVP
jgi:hypothetical protein